MTRQQAEAKAQKVVTAAMGHRNPKLEAFVSDALIEVSQPENYVNIPAANLTKELRLPVIPFLFARYNDWLREIWNLSAPSSAASWPPRKIGVYDYGSLRDCLKTNYTELFPDQPATDDQNMIQLMAAEIMNLRRQLVALTGLSRL